MNKAAYSSIGNEREKVFALHDKCVLTTSSGFCVARHTKGRKIAPDVCEAFMANMPLSEPAMPSEKRMKQAINQ